MFGREEIVTNGCSGGCCQEFTLPVTIGDLKLMKDEYDKKDVDENYEIKSVICHNGVSMKVADREEVEKLLEMLIPLGQTQNNPQDGLPLSHHCFGHWKKEDATVDKMRESQLRNRSGVTIHDDGKVTVNIYTCKHFDIVQKICTNYEKRPNLCKKFGYKCQYKGCEFTSKLVKIGSEAIKLTADETSNH